MPRIFSGRVIFYLLILLVLDMAVMPLFRIGESRPVLQYLAILYACFQWGWQRTLPMALAVGIMRDMTNSPLIGVETVSLVLVSLWLDFASQKMERRSLVMRLATSFLFITCVFMVQLIFLNFLTDVPPLSGHNVGVILLTSIYTTAVMPLFFNLTKRWFRERTYLKQYELFR